MQKLMHLADSCYFILKKGKTVIVPLQAVLKNQLYEKYAFPLYLLRYINDAEQSVSQKA